MPLHATIFQGDAPPEVSHGARSIMARGATVALLFLAMGCGPDGTEASGGSGGMKVSGSGGSGNNGTGGLGSGGRSSGAGGVFGSGGTNSGSGGASTSSGGVPGTGGTAATGGAIDSGGRSGAGGGGGNTGGVGGSGSSGQMAAGGGGGGSGAGGTTGATTCNKTGAATADTPTIWIIGDSTASLYASDVYPRMGWAQPMPDSYAAACAKVQDKALSGRSSKSFWDEGAWTPIRAALKAGDFVLIQFGHNDEKEDMPALYTAPQTTYKEFLSRYIDETKAKGGTPILITSICRNAWSNGKLTDSHGAYPPAMRELAAAKNVALVDATALTMAYLTRIGEAAAEKVYMNLAPGEFPNYPNGNSDDTHLQESGANKFLRIILADMARQKLPPGLLTKQVPQAP